MRQEVHEPLRGVLKRTASEKCFQLARYRPAKDLELFVELYWIVRWDLRQHTPHHQENLPHPCVQLAIEEGRSEIVGVVERKFSRWLEGRGRVFGVKFRPGGFYPFLQAPVAQLTNRVLTLDKVFGQAGEVFIEGILAAEEDDRMVSLADQFLLGQRPRRHAAIATVDGIVQRIAGDRELTRVDDLLPLFGMGKRQLQRLFKQYVGVSPKWVLSRYRLHEALEQIERDEAVDWAELAQDLGYFDQTHFIKDFRALMGTSPGDYARRGGTSGLDQRPEI